MRVSRVLAAALSCGLLTTIGIVAGNAYAQQPPPAVNVAPAAIMTCAKAWI